MPEIVESLRAAACHKHLPMMMHHVSYAGEYPVVVVENVLTNPPADPEHYCSCGYRAKYLLRTYTSMTANMETEVSLGIDTPVVTG